MLQKSCLILRPAGLGRDLMMHIIGPGLAVQAHEKRGETGLFHRFGKKQQKIFKKGLKFRPCVPIQRLKPVIWPKFFSRDP